MPSAPPHQRQLIRDQIVALLKAANTAAGTRVYESRRAPLRDWELPALNVLTGEESVDSESRNTAPRELMRQMTLTIEGYVSAPDSGKVDQTMDDLLAQVEIVMHADRFFGGLCMDSLLTGVETGISETGERRIAAVLITYDVTYRTFAPDRADQTLNDFVTADTKTQITGQITPVEDNITLT